MVEGPAIIWVELHQLSYASMFLVILWAYYICIPSSLSVGISTSLE